MASTAYIIISLAYYFLDGLPSYRHEKDEREHDPDRCPGKAMRRFSKFFFYAATANLGVCFILLVLKLAGLLEWW